jgi:hypothetical protein
VTGRDWTETDLSGDPRLLLGQRKSSKKIEVHQVQLHEDLFGDLRSIAQSAIEELRRRDAKPYSTFASKTGDDYFDVDVSDIPRRRDMRKREDDPEAYEIASALAMIADTDDHPVMTAEELREADPSLYAIVFESEGDYVGFIRNSPPRRAVRPGLRYFQYGETLRRVAPPDLAIDDEVDLVVAADRCAILSPAAFTTLFGDVGVAFEQVPANVKAMSDALKGVLPLSSGSVTALNARTGRRVSDAKRLHHIVTERRGALKGLTSAELRTLLRRRGLEDAIQKGEISLTDDNVSDFLDLVEGRLFSDDVTGEERRADTYSPRSH